MSKTVDTAPETDTGCIRFEIRDGMRRINCAVANEALEAAAGLPAESSSMLRRRSFDRFRTLIHAAAAMRLAALPQGAAGPIVLTSRDLRRVPHETGTPAFGTAAWRPAQPAASANAPGQATPFDRVR